MPVAEVGHDGKDDVGNPCGEHRREVSIDGKCGRYRLQHDVGEAQGQTDAQVESHATLALARRQRQAYDGEDERGEGRGYALVILHLILHHVARAAVNLLGDVLAQLRRGERLLLAFRVDQVGPAISSSRPLPVYGIRIL